MIKILIVEDEVIVALDIKSTLIKLGYEVTDIVTNYDKAISSKKNKKTLGRLECRITRCPVSIWSVCFWSPVKMVCFCFNV